MLFIASVQDTQWSVKLVGMSNLELSAPFSWAVDRVIHSDSLLCHGRDLNLIMTLLVAVEHYLHAVEDECSCLFFAHIISSSVLHENLTVVWRKTSQEEVLFDLGSVEITASKEDFAIIFADTSNDSCAPKWVHLHSHPIVLCPDEVVVVSWSHEESTVLRDFIVFSFLL